MSELSLCPSCNGPLYTLTEFCPHCKVRLYYSARIHPPLGNTGSPGLPDRSTPRTNAKELETAANLCAKLSGVSLLWPIVALGIAVFQGHAVDAVIGLFMGLVPAAAGAGCFAAASIYFRAEKRRFEASSDLIHGVVFGLGGFGVWAYALNFFLNFKY
jgi:hypothetical protein